MKRLSLQWRITLMSVLLIGITCVAMNLLLCSSGVYYMDTIADSLQGGGTVILNDSGAASFDPQLIAPNEELTIVVDGAQGRFRTTNWYITAAVTLLSGILAYFVSGRALKPLRSFASQVEMVQMTNLADMKIDEDVLPEFKQLSRSFNQMLERLNNAFTAQRQFTGNAAHELRTPLTNVRSYAETIREAGDDLSRETENDFLDVVISETDRMTHIVQDLLTLSRLDSGRSEMNMARFPFSAAIDSVLRSTELEARRHKHELTHDYTENLPLIMGDRGRIEQVMLNVLSNAVKYTPDGGHIRVTAGSEGETVWMEVADDGIGIPEADRSRIFERFYRVDKARSRESGGTGLGLSIATEIVQRHHGSLTLVDRPGPGTTVRLELPITQPIGGEDSHE